MCWRPVKSQRRSDRGLFPEALESHLTSQSAHVSQYEHVETLQVLVGSLEARQHDWRTMGRIGETSDYASFDLPLPGVFGIHTIHTI